MKPSLTALLSVLMLSQLNSASAQSTAFFYGPSIPEELIAAYDRVVVEPAHGFTPHLSKPENEQVDEERKSNRAELVAYLSVGEVAKTSQAFTQLKRQWILSKNNAWNSAIIDLSSREFQAHFLQTRFEPLFQRGYRTFFLDTLDSYHLLPDKQGTHVAQRAGLITLIKAMHRSHPDVRLLANRGFEVLSELAPVLSGVVAESLFDRFDAAAGRYTRVSEPDRLWLLGKLRQARDRHHLPVTVIDYRPPAQREAARKTARRIEQLGFTPYVSDGALHGVGIGPFEIVPRKVLVLTNTAPDESNRANRILAPLLEYLGYVPEFYNISEHMPLPVPRVAGAVIVWIEGKNLAPGYADFINEQLQTGMRFVFFGDPRLPIESAAAQRLGFKEHTAPMPGHFQLQGHAPVAKPNIGLNAIAAQLSRIRLTGNGVVPHLEAFSTDHGSPARTLVATTPWGGIALSHFLVANGLHGEVTFTLDPIEFLTRALAQDEHPAFDLTTEHGQRLATIVVRAAGLAEPSRLPGRPSNLQTFKRLLRKHPVPHTLDLTHSATNAVTPQDARRGASLLRFHQVEAASPAPSQTMRLRFDGTLTELTPLLPLPGSPTPTVSLGGDYRYLPPGITESFPFSRLAETLSRTDSPRRLCPAVLDFHAASLASPGGRATIQALYETLVESNSKFVSSTTLGQLTSGFAKGTLIRHLDGGYELLGTTRLRTLRIPSDRHVSPTSIGVADTSELPQGHYITFRKDGPHRLYLTSTPGTDTETQP